MASLAETVVANIQGLSSKRDDWASLQKQLETHSGVLGQNVALIDNILQELNPEQHAIGCIFVLEIKATNGAGAGAGAGQVNGVFLQQVKRVIMGGDAEQLRFVRRQVCDLCRIFAEHCRGGGMSSSMFGVRVLLTAAEKVRETPEHLTPIHGDALQLALMGKLVKPVLGLIQQRVLHVTKELMQPRDFLLYFYYGGMCFAAVKEMSKALEMFQLAFTMPCQALNEIMVEIHKKYVLLSLIVHGEVQSLPKYTSNLVQRLNKSCCSEYNDIATACGTHEVTEVEAAVERHKAVLQRDNNYGLAKQAMASVYSRNIQRLTQTFVTLSLEDIGQQVKLGDAAVAKKRVLEMIERNMIVATIDEQMGMVSFDTEPDKTSSQQLLLRLTAQIQTSMELNDKLREVDEQVSANPVYLSKISAQERQSRWDGSAEWVAQGATGDEMLVCDSEKPPGFNFGGGRSA